MRSEIIIEDCAWNGWCREECKCRKLQTTITYNDLGIPICKITESVPINRNNCFHLDCTNYVTYNALLKKVVTNNSYNYRK